MKNYNIELVYTVVVEAENETDAYDYAENAVADGNADLISINILD